MFVAFAMFVATAFSSDVRSFTVTPAAYSVSICSAVLGQIGLVTPMTARRSN
jgi:hypothetical protein